MIEPKCQSTLEVVSSSRLAVVTLATGQNGRELLALSGKSLASYATKCGADFHVIGGEPTQSDFPFEDKWRAGQYLDFYDRVFYTDADVLIRPDAPNLFDLVGEELLGICDENLYTAPRLSGWWGADRQVMSEIQRDNGFPECTGAAYYNAGFWVASRRHRPLFSHPTVPYRAFHEAEQCLLNARILNFEVPIHVFGPDLVWCHYAGPKRANQPFLHFSGAGIKDQLRMMKSVGQAL